MKILNILILRCILFNSSWWEFTKIFKIYMERTTISVLFPPKWTFTMSQMVYKAIETTISRAEEIKTWYICIYWWYLSSRWHQGKLHQKYYRYCHTIKVFGVYRSCRKITIFINPKAWYFRFHNKLSQHDGFIEEGEKRATCLSHKKNNK